MSSADLFSSVVSDIKSYSGKDPLCPWLRGIRRLRELLPRHILDEKLPRFLQRCVETFESDRRYRSDIRFLRVWMQLMDHVEDPRAVFRRMEKNQIGVKHAAFYVAYSLYYEKQKNFDAAEKMFLLGAQRLAEPAEDLQKSYEQFRCRMELYARRKSKMNQRRTSQRERNSDGHPRQKTQSIDSVKPPPSEDTVVVNFVGSAMVGKSTAEDACHHGLVDPTVNMKEALNAISSMFKEPLEIDQRHARKANRIPPQSTRPSDHAFEIFVDDDQADKTANRLPPRSTRAADHAFEIFADDQADKKSNQIPPQSSRPSDHAFEIFVDDGQADENANPIPPRSSSNDDHDQADKKSNRIPPRSKHPADHTFKIFVDDDRPDERPTGPDIFVDQNNDDDDDDDDDDDGDDDLDQGHCRLENPREDTVVFRFVGSTIAGDRATENACHSGLVDPTINLKEAIDEINGMFGKPIEFDRAGRRREGTRPRHQDFAILADADVDQQPVGSTSAFGSGPDSGLFEPTVFTKEAMCEINDLFSKPLDF